MAIINSVDGARQDGPDLPQALKETEYFDHIKKINDVFYDQIKLSDQKAAYIFTFMLALLVTSSQAKSALSWQHYVSGSAVSIACSICFAVFSIFSIICAISSVLPRHARKSTSLFWGSWGVQREAFERAAHRGDMEYLFQQYLDNADVLAMIAQRKFKLVRLAFWGMMGTVLSYVCTLIFF